MGFGKVISWAHGLSSCDSPFLGASQVALVVKNLPVSAGDIGDLGLIPGLGRSPAGGNGNPLQYSCLENRMDRGAWRGAAHSVTESDKTDELVKKQDHTLARRQILPSEVAQSCPTLCYPVEYSPPGSSVHGILQARIPE